MFNRLVTDIVSKYYRLMDIVLDYLLSLLEGNDAAIMNYFSSNFDIPVLYGFTVNLMVLLFKRVSFKLIKRGTPKTATLDGTLTLVRTPRRRSNED